MKLEVGMYVRTKKGTIYKFDTNNSMAKNGAKKYMVNCSYNIIDLIEVGDYVNGLLVTRILEDNETNEKYINLYGSISEWEEEDIKSIVTKEQFSSIEYRLGDK